jgi:hypothetical protein
MPSKKDVQNQEKLLATYRQQLLDHLKQQAVDGASIRPRTVRGIADARDNIRRIKENLRSWSAAVEDLPDDEG